VGPDPSHSVEKWKDHDPRPVSRLASPTFHQPLAAESTTKNVTRSLFIIGDFF
jgi:hypothetical protein